MARLVPLTTCLSLPEALVAKSYLEDHGVFADLNGYYHGSIAWHLLFALHGVQISVLDIEFERAAALLRYNASAAHAEITPSPNLVQPPPTVFEIMVAALVLILAGIPLPLWVRRQRFVAADDEPGQLDQGV